MSRFIHIIVAIITLFVATSTDAQTIALRERTPRVKKANWLNGNVPKKCDFTYIEFILSGSTPCRNSAERVHKIINEFGNIAFVLISHQEASDIDHWVTDHISPTSGVIIDDDRIRTSFGVNYAPYAVILDHKRRALWFGNPQLLNRTTIEKLTEN
jgi:hypothetical protein